MELLRWMELSRLTLSNLLPEAVVVLPIGAVEQHGPHLPTGTDIILATEICERAILAASESSARKLVLAPAISVGVSEHHKIFGGTLSVAPTTLMSIFADLVGSMHRAGARRLVIVNGHGGNMGVCRAAAAAAAAKHSDFEVAYLDYWVTMPATAGVPGHAGEFETSLMLAVRADIVGDLPQRETVPDRLTLGGMELHAERRWTTIDGFTDNPSLASGEKGERWLSGITDEMAHRLIEVAATL